MTRAITCHSIMMKAREVNLVQASAKTLIKVRKRIEEYVPQKLPSHHISISW